MGIMELLHKLGIYRSGSVAATYTNAAERPTELQMDNVFNAEKDLIRSDAKASSDATPPSSDQSSASPPASPAQPPDTPPKPEGKNPMALAGLIVAFFVPLVGLILSIVGLVKSNKPNTGGKGLAIAGIITSLVIGVLQLLLFMGVIVALISGSKMELTTYTDTTHGYTVRYPEEWEQKTENVGDVESIVFEDEYGDTGKVTGRVEVVYTPPPNKDQKLKSNALQIYRDELKKQNPDTTVEFETETTQSGNPALRMISTYRSETGRIKAKTTIIRMKDDSVYIVSTQSPIENYEDYSDSFDEIHTTFTP